MARTKTELLIVTKADTESGFKQIGTFTTDTKGMSLFIPLPEVGDRLITDLQGLGAGRVTDRCFFYTLQDLNGETWDMVFRIVITVELDETQENPPELSM